jgi:hypothetical protein
VATSIEYRLRAEQYLNLSKETDELYAKEVLTELAEEFTKAAEKLERGQSARLSRQY